jgi:hypothetical protein
VAAADWLTLGCCVAACVLALIGDHRQVLGGTPVTVRWVHAAFAAVAIGAIRHASVPTPSLLTWLAAWPRWLAARPALSDAVLVFVLTRPAVLLVGLFAVAAIGFPSGVEEPGTGRQALPALPARFDANWYSGIAAEGYDWQGRFDRQQNLAFFPAYPMLIRVVGALVGAHDTDLPRERRLQRLAWCGLATSLAAFFGAAWLLSSLAGEILGRGRARDALLLLAAYPFAVFFSAAYTESLFLLAALGAWYSLRQAQPIRAGVWGLVAGLSRPNGFLLSVPLLMIAIGIRGAPGDGTPTTSRLARLSAAAMPGIGMLLFTSYLHQRTGVWFAWARMHGAWGRVFTGDAPVSFAAGGTGLLHAAITTPYDTLNSLGVAFALAMTWPVWRKLGPSWCAFVLINVLPPLFAGGVLSMGRLSSTLFPVFLALASVLPSRTVPAVVVMFGMLQGLVAVLFYTWRSLY